MNSRRKFLKTAGAAGLFTAITPSIATAGNIVSVKSKRVMRIAHITDVHILKKENAEKCFSRVLTEINAMKDKPDFIINTGDTVMDENRQTRETVEERWGVWQKVVGQTNALEIHSALGNHDVWYGPDEALDAEYKRDKRYGKQWAMDVLKLPSRYYSFSAKGWKFVCLDSINGTNGYQLDEEQFGWLERELAGTTQPVLVYSHVPILSMGALLYYTQRKPLHEVKFPSGDMHNDHQRIKSLFHKSGKVKVCLSGHVHYVDGVDYLGVKYLCNGAVSGNWWGDPIALEEFPPVYAVIDLYDDGSSVQQLVHYNTEV
jgi:3',5'-cyclic-AMP phosphodiesterase